MKYLVFFLLVVSTNFYGIVLFNEIPWLNINSGLAILLSFLMLFNKNSLGYFYKDIKDLVYWSFISVIIASIIALVDWGQTFLLSFVASRGVLMGLIGLFLVKFRVSKRDVVWGLKWFSFVNIILVFVGALDDGIRSILLSKNIEDPAFNGAQFLILYVYIHFEKTFKIASIKNIVICVLFFTAIVLMASRSILFSFMIVMGVYFLIYLKINYMLKVLLGVSLIFGTYYAVADVFELLYSQTISELSNNDYNRIKSFNYWVFEFNKNWYGNIFGNGFASLNSKYGELIKSLKTRGIFQSDMGFLGLWTIYGLPMVFILIKKTIKIVRLKNMPLYLRWTGCQVLIGSLIYSYVTPEQIFYWVVFFYLFCLEKKEVLMVGNTVLNTEK